MDTKIKIRYYSISDLSYGIYLSKVVEETNIIMSKTNHDLFDVLNLYEISLYLDDYNFLNDYGKKLIRPLLEFKTEINKIVGKFFTTMDNKKFVDILNELQNDYYAMNPFLKCISKYNALNNVDDKTFKYTLENNLLSIYNILHHKQIINKYSEVVRSYLLNFDESAEFLMKKYDMTDEEQIYLPKLSSEDKTAIISNYIVSEKANINYLKILDFHIDSKDTYILTSKQRLEIKESIKIKSDEIHRNGFTIDYGIKIIIDPNLENPVPMIMEGNIKKYIFPGKWFDQNLDYPTLLNNFIYIFNYFDSDLNIKGLANQNIEGIFQRVLFKNSTTSYGTGLVFQSNEFYNYLSFGHYINYLKQKHNIDIEDIIEWFFNEYLPKEFNILNFNVSLSTDKKYINRCKVLFPEFDSILKKYGLYSEYKYINNNLMNASKERFKVEDCPSMIETKYLIINKENNDILKILNLLFSDQSHISYIDNTLNERTFAELLIKHKIKITYFKKRRYQLDFISLFIR